ncbi:MAG TPA: hypothetical protein VFN67_33780 [Polyangiales bacterium]|nr:hypothetical protein [Polyangiales bacterium]
MTLNIEITIISEALAVMAKHKGHIHAHIVDLLAGDSNATVQAQLLTALQKVMREPAVARAIDDARRNTTRVAP